MEAVRFVGGAADMARYYFHLWNGSGYELDEKGLELPSAEEAYLEAFHAAQEIWYEVMRARKDPSAYRFTVLEERGRVVLDFPFVETFAAVPRRRSEQPLEDLLLRQQSLASDLRREIALAQETIAARQKNR